MSEPTTGIDINVWNATLYGDHPAPCVVITGYEMTIDPETGSWDTDTNKILFSLDTKLPVDEWDDEWYGLSSDTLPHELPPEVLALVRPELERLRRG